MDVQIKPGIQALVLPDRRFKTVRIDLHFLKHVAIKDLAARSLVANILETSTQKYNNQVKFTHALSEMFGASFGVGAGKKGNTHDVGFSIIVANDKYVQGQSLIRTAIDFLNEVIMHPLRGNNGFDDETFMRQKQNMINYVKSSIEDKQYWSAQQLRSLTFGTKVIQGVPGYGLIEDLEGLQNEDVYRAYLDMIENDLIHISVSGDVDSDAVLQDLSRFEFTKRNINLGTLITNFAVLDHELKRVEHQDVKQARLNLSYNIPAFITSDDSFTAIVFNSLFGGSPQSKLFVNVREKASLAYYASSSLDLYDGILNVQTGINGMNHDQTVEIINRQLEDIQNGDFAELELNNIKKGLRSDYLAGMDQQRTAHRRGLNDYLLHRHVSAEQWLEKLDEVTKQNIEEMARRVKVRAEFFLNGD